MYVFPSGLLLLYYTCEYHLKYATVKVRTLLCVSDLLYQMCEFEIITNCSQIRNPHTLQFAAFQSVPDQTLSCALIINLSRYQVAYILRQLLSIYLSIHKLQTLLSPKPQKILLVISSSFTILGPAPLIRGRTLFNISE